MHRDWFFPSQLAARISRGGVPNREVGYFMLANLLFGSVIFYGAFTWANPPWTALSLLEFAAIVVVTIVGMTKCYDAAGGDSNPSFAMQFNCLSFGVWFWCTVITWSVYWAVVWLFRQGVFAAYRLENLGLANNLAAIGGSFGWLWTVLALVLSQVAYFWWLQRVLPLTRSDAYAPATALQKTGVQPSRRRRTLRSSVPPPAWHLGRAAPWSMLRRAAQAHTGGVRSAQPLGVTGAKGARLFSHIFVSVTDFDRALKFYTAVMQALGNEARFCEPGKPWAGWHSEGRSRPYFVICRPYDGQPHHPGNGQMVAFAAKDRTTVEVAYEAALRNGGTSEGLPGLRPEYHAHYYGAYFRDPEGNKVCVASHGEK